MSPVYLAFRGRPVDKIRRKALTRASAHWSLEETRGEWEDENAPAPRRYTALSIPRSALFPLARCSSLWAATLSRRVFSVALEILIPPRVPEAVPGLFRADPRRRSDRLAGVSLAGALA